MKGNPEFLHTFYKWLCIWGGIGLGASLAFAGWLGLGSYGSGLLLMALVILQWALTLRMFLGPRKTSLAFGSLLAFMQYGLPAAMIYGIISWFVVSWPWFFAGMATVLPSLLTAAFLFKDETGATNAKD